MIRQRLKKIKQNQDGTAMILALCVLAVVVVLCLLLILVSSMTVANAQQKLSKEQSRLLAVSFSKQLQQEITATTAESPQVDGAAPSIRTYLRTNVNQESWPFFNEDERGHSQSQSFRTYQIDTNTLSGDIKGISADLTLTLYWTSESGASPDSSVLYTVVTADCQEQKSTITTTYSLDIKTGIAADSVDVTDWTWSFNGRE